MMLYNRISILHNGVRLFFKVYYSYAFSFQQGIITVNMGKSTDFRLTKAKSLNLCGQFVKNEETIQGGTLFKGGY